VEAEKKEGERRERGRFWGISISSGMPVGDRGCEGEHTSSVVEDLILHTSHVARRGPIGGL